ncbi:MAG TPA: DUF4116 domain-containing protein [Candidatus Bathyarchaeia archaeon]|nr:DUF4116 domain-containing protein [Candidatus Bathyarchaeia archaeon]
MEQFNPSDPRYKEVGDLPEEQRENFVDVESGGFARKEAEEKYREARSIAEFVNSMRSVRLKKIIEDVEILHLCDYDDREKITSDVQRAMEVKLTAADILHAEGVKYDVDKPITMKGEFLRQGYWDLERASEDLRADKDIVMTAISECVRAGRNFFSLDLASEELRADKDVVLASFGASSDNFRYASENLRGDKEVVLAAIRAGGHGASLDILKYASEEMRDDDEVATVVLHDKHDTRKNFEFLSERLRSDKGIALAALAHRDNGKLICLVSENLQGDRDVAMKSILSGNIKLENISEELRSDKNFLLEVMDKLDGYDSVKFYTGLSPEMQKDKKIIISLISSHPRYSIDIPVEALKDRDIVLEIFKYNPSITSASDIPKEFREDETLIFEAMKYRSGAFWKAGLKLRSDKNFILKAIQMSDGRAMEAASDELKNDFDFVLLAFQTNSNTIEYASKEILDKLEKFMPVTVTGEKGRIMVFHETHSLKKIK